MSMKNVYSGCAKSAQVFDSFGGYIEEQWLFDRSENRYGFEAWQAHARRILSAQPLAAFVLIRTVPYYSGAEDGRCLFSRADNCEVPRGAPHGETEREILSTRMPSTA